MAKDATNMDLDELAQRAKRKLPFGFATLLNSARVCSNRELDAARITQAIGHAPVPSDIEAVA
jgi:hypothetical protein